MTTVPDPRPAVTRHGDDATAVVHGARCDECGHPSWWTAPRCQRCGGAVTAAMFGPSGVVWSSTVVRVPVPGRTPPYTLAYIDLADGPRLLAHVDGCIERLAPGTPVRVRGTTDAGDVLVEVCR